MKNLCKIRELYRSLIDFENQFIKKYDLCLNEGMLLCKLNESGKLSSGEIAELLKLTFSNTSKVIRSVENKKLVKRILGNEDKRQMYFTLTKAGESKVQSLDCHLIDLADPLKSYVDQLN